VARVPGYRSRGPWFDYRGYQIIWEIVGLERGPLSLVSTIEKLLGRNSSGSGLENRECGRGYPLCWPCDTFYLQKLALTSPTRGGRSGGIVCLRTKAPEFVFSSISSYVTACTVLDIYLQQLNMKANESCAVGKNMSYPQGVQMYVNNLVWPYKSSC
jgi:hypothetical protein